jgi:2-succinyl-6-hydroxy-2,4-cyclohexadiene-1-carboxylate synthase
VLTVELEGAGQPLVLLHGFTGSMRVWDDVRFELRSSATVVAIDLIGHGRSPKPSDPARYSLAHATADLASVLDTLALDRVSLLGYSMGGRVALHFALAHSNRVRRLILESASPGLDDPFERQFRVQRDDDLARRIETRGVAAFVAEWEQQPLLALAPHVTDEVWQRQHAQRLSNDQIGLANSLRGMGAGQQAPLWSRLPELSMPVTLIVGESDFRYRGIAERMRPVLPEARLEVVPDAGHTVHVDQPAAYVRLVKAAIAPADQCPKSTN